MSLMRSYLHNYRIQVETERTDLQLARLKSCVDITDAHKATQKINSTNVT